MKEKITNIIDYLRPLIEGIDGKISLKNVITIAFVVGFIYNINRATEGTLGIMAGIIAGLLGLQVYNNLNQRKIDNECNNNENVGTNGGRGGTN